ncbi:MAG: glycoside hydrolase family 9 protein, partial [Bacteroidota bacterium]
LTAAGSYFVFDPANQERSAVFEINENPYLDVLKIAGRMFFYNRCNAPKAAPYAEANWTDGNNFLNPLQDANCRFIYDTENSSLEKDLSGGWFDAGDYNKYVTFAEGTIHDLLYAYEENPAAFGDDWNIPESGNGIPDLLDEIKWELDWLLKMNNDDGSVQIKMGSRNYSENTASPPSANTDRRYYGPTCTSASAACANMFAHAAIVLDGLEGIEGYSFTLREHAERAFEYTATRLAAGTLEFDCDDGSIVAGDADRDQEGQLGSMVAAAVYLYELTGDEAYHQFFQQYYNNVPPMSFNFWGADAVLMSDALIRYTNLNNGVSSIQNAIINSARNNVNQNSNGFWGWQENSLYRSFGAAWTYFWGSNRPMASYATINAQMADNGIGNDLPSLRRKATEHLHYFHGVNPLGLVMLSNMYDKGGDRCVNEIYHTWFFDGTEYDNALTSAKGPAPGFVTGGPNASFSVSALSPPANQPKQKSYLDFNTSWPDNSWEISEPAIYYQAAYIRMLAYSVPSSAPLTNVSTVASPIEKVAVFPNPAADYISLDLPEGAYQLSVMDEQGRVLQKQLYTSQTNLSVRALPAGIYFVEATAVSSGRLYRSKWVKG